jgi:hypothetical protein
MLKPTSGNLSPVFQLSDYLLAINQMGLAFQIDIARENFRRPMINNPASGIALGCSRMVSVHPPSLSLHPQLSYISCKNQ